MEEKEGDTQEDSKHRNVEQVGEKHKLEAQKRNKMRENPKHKTCPKIPPQGQPGTSRNQLAPRVHNLHTGGTADGQSLMAGGTAQNWDPQGLPISPEPLDQPPALPP